MQFQNHRKLNNLLQMKVKIMALALLITGFACQAQNEVDKQGRKQGHWIKTDKNGVKIFEGNFVDGLETGTFEYFYPDGTIKIRNVYKTPGTYCSHEAFDEKGNRLAEGFYNKRNRDGEWRFYTEEGKLIKIANYNMGIKEGAHIIFTSKGDTAEVCNWSDNRRNGRWWKRVGTNGYITGIYSKGSLEGRLTEYDNNGQLVREGFYINGRKDGQYKYFENNQLTVDETWKDGYMLDRKVRFLFPEETFVSIYNIAYLVPQGKRLLVYMKDGSKKSCNESADAVYARIGDEMFSCANKKNRIMVSNTSVKGFTTDNEGREILKLDPQPDFTIFPDEDCKKMVQSRRHQAEAQGELEGWSETQE